MIFYYIIVYWIILAKYFLIGELIRLLLRFSISRIEWHPYDALLQHSKSNIFLFPFQVILKCNINDSSFLFSQVYNMILITVCTYYAIMTRKVDLLKLYNKNIYCIIRMPRIFKIILIDMFACLAKKLFSEEKLKRILNSFYYELN
jgi:hypothetical protein